MPAPGAMGVPRVAAHSHPQPETNTPVPSPSTSLLELQQQLLLWLLLLFPLPCGAQGPPEYNPHGDTSPSPVCHHWDRAPGQPHLMARCHPAPAGCGAADEI